MRSEKYRSFRQFPNARLEARTLYPHVCLRCRKSFRRPASAAPRKCPQCAEPMFALSRKFKAPPMRDAKQWAKVAYLVRSGISFHTAYRRLGPLRISMTYPRTLRQARAFVAEFRAGQMYRD